jgi:3-mercaptopyruvate sulfurtransferase SseA
MHSMDAGVEENVKLHTVQMARRRLSVVRRPCSSRPSSRCRACVTDVSTGHGFSGVIVYCRSGTRAALAASTLKTLGYDNVANLDGGFVAWRDAGLPTEEHNVGI